MDNNISQQLKDLTSKNQNIGIAVGKNPGVDEMAAALSLFLALKSNGKNVNIVCPTEPLVEHSRLVGIDKVQRNFELQGGDMTVSFPYQEGEIEKISYTLENGLLNIIVKAGQDGLSFNEKDVMFKRSEDYPTLLFVIGTPRLSDLDRIYDAQALKDTTVINIDNKSDNQGYGDISIVTPNSSSISEKITDLMLSMGLNLDIDIAQNLLTGIEKATNNFQNSRTTPLAFEITGELIRKGAVRSADNNIQGELPKTNREDLNDFDEEDLSPDYRQSAFSRQTLRPASMRQQSMAPRMNRQSNAGADLQRLQNMQRQQNQNMPPASQNLENRQPGEQDMDIERKDRKEKKPPVDWLTPKIYKGSTNI